MTKLQRRRSFARAARRRFPRRLDLRHPLLRGDGRHCPILCPINAAYYGVDGARAQVPAGELRRAETLSRCPAEPCRNPIPYSARLAAEAAEELLRQGLALRGGDLVEARLAARGEQEFVAGRQRVDEAEAERFARQPDVAVADLGDVEAGPALLDEALERLVGRVELAAEMLAPLRA